MIALVKIGAASESQPANQIEMESKDNEQENIHFALSKESCYKMRDRYHWDLKRIDDLPDGVNCVFKGKQVNFWEMWHDHQDDEDDKK